VSGAGFLVAMLVVVLAAIWFVSAPPNSFNLFCTYDLAYRLRATIEADGTQYASEVVHQRSFSRKWIEVMNSAGCEQTHGTVLSYRLNDDRVVLIEARICQQALNAFDAAKGERLYEADYRGAMIMRRQINLADYCIGLDASRDRKLDSMRQAGSFHAYLIDNAEKPSRWEPFNLGGPLKATVTTIRLVSASAQAIDTAPRDELDRVAPGVLKTRFQTNSWWYSPERLIAFSRRSGDYTAQQN
jgi:hypothetical protein